MDGLTYTHDYWKRAWSLIERDVHECEYCHNAHCENKGEFYCFVRVIDIGKTPGDPMNLVLACTRCRPSPSGPRLSRKQILDQIGELPFPRPAASKVANG